MSFFSSLLNSSFLFRTHRMCMCLLNSDEFEFIFEMHTHTHAHMRRVCAHLTLIAKLFLFIFVV